jgi:hypothetical protein
LPHIKVRPITDADIPSAISLLTRGYGPERASGIVRPRSFWEGVFSCLSERPLPVVDLPRYGYVIDSGGQLVGIMLLIFSEVWENGRAKIRCGGSAVYVDPTYRLYAPLLIRKASDFKDATILNLTPSQHTFRMIEALGYVKYCDGIFVSIPLLSRRPPDKTNVSVVDAHTKLDISFDPHERDLLLEHARCGCISLWCVTPREAHPFVFRTRWVKHVPCAQLVYCRDVDDFVRFARPLGSFLSRHTGRFLVFVDANGPIQGLVGKYFASKAIRYFAGSDRPRLGDLAYTEISLFGI